MNAATHHGQTWLTITYDPQLLKPDEAQQLGEMYEQQIAHARDELL